VAHETEFQSRALEAWAYHRSMRSTSFSPANQRKQTRDEAWQVDEKQHRLHGALGHPTPIVFVAQPQTSRAAEKFACSSSELSRDGTNVRMSPQRRLNHNKTDNGATARTATATIAIRTLLRASKPPRTSIVRRRNDVPVMFSAHLSPIQNNNGIVNP